MADKIKIITIASDTVLLGNCGNLGLELGAMHAVAYRSDTSFRNGASLQMLEKGP